jgi:hypothetical protein
MPSHAHVPAAEPEDLERLYVERVNAGDVEGLVALFEPDAVIAFASGGPRAKPDREPRPEG